MASPPQQQQQQPETSPESSPDNGTILVPVSNPPSENPSVQSTPLGSPAHSPYAASPRSSFIGSRHRAVGSLDSRPRSINHVKFSVGPRVFDDDDAYVPPKTSSSLSSVAPAAVTGVGASVNHHARNSTGGKTSSRPPSPATFSLMSTGRSLASGEPSPPAEYANGKQVTTPNDESCERLVQGSTTPPVPPELPEDEFELDDEATGHKKNALGKAQERARKLASMMHKPTLQRRRLGTESFRLPNLPKMGRQDIQSAPPMQSSAPKDPFTASSTAAVTPENEAGDDDYTEKLAKHRSHSAKTHEAHNLVKHLTRTDFEPLSRVYGRHDTPQTPYEEQGEDYVERPKQYRGGILATLLKLYETQRMHEEQSTRGRKSPGSESPSRPRSAFSPHWRPGQHPHSRTPSRPRWYEKNMSTNSVPSTPMPGTPRSSSPQLRPSLPRSLSSGGLASMAKKILPNHGRLEDEIRITVHIAETLARQEYLVKCCRALMLYGAPTHRLEEYMRMSARVLEIDSQYLYIPGCMIISFDDATTHTTEVRLVRQAQGIELGRLADVHEIYKEVVHDVIGVEEAMSRLDEVMKQKPKYNIFWITIWYGLAAICVGPFAFGARPIDAPVAFLLGAILGLLQHYVAPRSDLYSNVFEVSAAIITSFLARAFGSIRHSNGEYVFCFAALAQSSIALILPGYIVLCGALELQSKNLVAGSVRMVYAILYSLFLGFGILIGTALYGLMDSHASSEYKCPASPITNEYLNKFPSVIGFTLCLVLANHGRVSQMPAMTVISFAGYVVNLFATRRFYYNTQVANTLAAFTIGALGNLYSRIAHGLAAAAILPAIFVQVPSGLAATGSLLSGITFADEMTHNRTGADSTGLTFGDAYGSSRVYGNVVFDLSYGMIQVAIGITVGLFLSALVVYPLGKRRSGLFTF